jgi:hypothetical protein
MSKVLITALFGGVIAFFIFDGDQKLLSAVNGSAAITSGDEVETAEAPAPKKKSRAKKVVEPIDVGAPRRVIVGLDLSSSNPLVDDTAYARKAGQRVKKDFETLAFRSEVRIRTFGAYDSSSNPFSFDATVSTRQRPEVLARDMQTFISNIPMLVRQGKLKTQPNTNILAFLEELSLNTDCKSLPTQVILVTDGVEDSEYVRLKYRDAKLPKPKKIFRGCHELQMLGIGRGVNSVKETNRIRAEWKKWAKSAGFATFSAVNDW